MIREPEQPLLGLKAAEDLRPPVDPRTLRVSTHKPAAPDGEEWLEAVVRSAEQLGVQQGRFSPSELRKRCEERGCGRPPNGKPQWWGIAYGRLRDLGWTKDLLDATSTLRSRNGAKDVWEWIAPGHLTRG